MNYRDVIRLSFAFLIILWLSVGGLPRKLMILSDEPRICYDNFITSQEFLADKKLAKLKKSKNISPELKRDVMEELAFILWSERKLDDALKLYQQVKSEREKVSNGYDQKLINTLISIAGIYRDLNRLDDSIDYYEKIWQLDKAHLSADDLRLARDQTSMAVIAYVAGEIQQDDKKHEKFMNNCLSHINYAQDILQKQKTPQTARLANLLHLKCLVFRELDQKQASKECHKAADLLTKKLKRPYMVPWT